MIENPAERPDRDGDASEPASARGRLLLVGAERRVRRLVDRAEQGPWSSLPIVGFVDVSGRGRQLVVHPGSRPVPVLGRMDRLDELVDRSGATDLVVALSERPAVRLRTKLEGLRGKSVRVHWLGETARADVPGGSAIAPPPWPVGRAPWPLVVHRAAKRLFDASVAAAALLALSPLFLVVSAIILMSAGRPIFYTQRRIGRGGRVFDIWKFRSMRNDAEVATGPIWASDHDARCTRIGQWLRHTNIDELPQLFNVLMGDMSLVGPGPSGRSSSSSSPASWPTTSSATRSRSA